jgi:Domain of unknown function (DUF4174)
MSSRNKSFLLLVSVLMINTSFQDFTPRKLLLFGKGQLAFQKQLQWLEIDSLGVTERDLKIEAVEFNSELAKRFHIKSGEFTVLLIGRDGGEKYRTHEPVTTKRLFGTIDAMPMRQSEIQKKKGSE